MSLLQAPWFSAAHAPLRPGVFGQDDQLRRRSAGFPTATAATATRRSIRRPGGLGLRSLRLRSTPGATLAYYPHPPQACLVNFYDGQARMGLHQDRDEEEFAAPVVSISLGDSCCFRYGGLRRARPGEKARTALGRCRRDGRRRAADLSRRGQNFRRLSGLLPGGGRINLTLRRVTRPAQPVPRPRRRRESLWLRACCNAGKACRHLGFRNRHASGSMLVLHLDPIGETIRAFLRGGKGDARIQELLQSLLSVRPISADKACSPRRIMPAKPPDRSTMSFIRARPAALWLFSWSAPRAVFAGLGLRDSFFFLAGLARAYRDFAQARRYDIGGRDLREAHRAGRFFQHADIGPGLRDLRGRSTDLRERDRARRKRFPRALLEIRSSAQPLGQGGIPNLPGLFPRLPADRFCREDEGPVRDSGIDMNAAIVGRRSGHNSSCVRLLGPCRGSDRHRRCRDLPCRAAPSL